MMTENLKNVLEKWFRGKDYLFDSPEYVRHNFNELYFSKLYKKIKNKPMEEQYEFIQDDYAKTFHRYLRLNYDIDLNKSLEQLYFKHIGE